MTKLINLDFDKTQKLKCDNLWRKNFKRSFSKNILTPWQPMRCSLGSVLQFSRSTRCFVCIVHSAYLKNLGWKKDFDIKSDWIWHFLSFHLLKIILFMKYNSKDETSRWTYKFTQNLGNLLRLHFPPLFSLFWVSCVINNMSTPRALSSGGFW